MRCGSCVAETPCGVIEYGTGGSGTPVLAVHGSGGGYDQGFAMAEIFIGDGFQIIAPSRFGYRRTPLPADASVQAQAAAYACLLDALKIQRAIVVGYSAGAPSCLQFALQYPDRIAALVLLAPGLYAPGQDSHALRIAGIPVWLLMKANPSSIITWLLAASPKVRALLPPAVRARAIRSLQIRLPVRARKAGLVTDARAMHVRKHFPIERIGVPTLVCSARDDPYATYPAAEYTARTLPHARFLGFERGGHLLFGHREEIRSAVADLVRTVVPPV